LPGGERGDAGFPQSARVLNKLEPAAISIIGRKAPAAAKQENGMKALIMALLIASALPIVPAHAGPCGVEVSEYRNSLPQHGLAEDAVGSAPQSVSAQLSRQPTPASVERARKGAMASVTAALAEAEKLDAEGNQSACEDALAKAKLLANP
jgi:hypothetical protein